MGLISTIARHHGQENAALMFNGLTGSIHSRANALKLNIQLKLLQTGVDVPETSAAAGPDSEGHRGGGPKVGLA
ncbi:MAG: hypothetical protein O7B35_20190 [Deltaproteobacteria bacterium]|nr:hypothetical protein [Deltaproteobacteria bacterium]